MRKIIYYILFFLTFMPLAVASDDAQVSSDESNINYHFNISAQEQGEITSRSRSQRLFTNPALSSGLTSGTRAINRSIESLMEAVFYSVLDRELLFEVNPVTHMGVVLERDVIPTDQGAFVVIDRFSLGPRYNKRLAELGKIPVSLTGDVATNVFDIYLRSDAMRLGEHSDLSWWRQTANNWFGVLPLLTRVLPPAFNANELYDPFRMVENPFTFPKTKEGFYKMAQGGIRSYSLSSGVKIPLDISQLWSEEERKKIMKDRSFTLELPYSLFIEGEHRINVLRKSEHTAWIGLTKNRRIGHAISTRAGEILSALNKVSPLWSGIPVPIFPTDFALSQAANRRFDQLYEFDLRNPVAAAAYNKAAAGDFTQAYYEHLNRSEKNINTGVIYHFTREEDAIEYEGRNSFNAFAGRSSRATFHNTSEIEIKSPKGISHVLESSRETADEIWDMLLGQSRKTVQDKAELRVRKVIVKEKDSDKQKTKYIFSATDTNPITIYLHMQIFDTYANSFNYREYMDKLRSFTKLSLNQAPKFPLRESEKLKYRRQRFALASPEQDEFNTHVAYTQLGRFNAVAAVKIDTPAIRDIINQPEDVMWAAFAKAFGHDPDYWRQKENRVGIASVLNWTMALSAYPMRLFNYRTAYSDFIWEASRAIRAFQALRLQGEPMDKLKSFEDLFSTDHPDQLADAIMALAPLNKVPRSVTLYTRARGSASDHIKNQFRKLDGQVFKSNVEHKAPTEIETIHEKLDAFNPISLRETRIRPQIKNINVAARRLPDEALQEVTEEKVLASSGSAVRLDARQIFLEISAQNIKLKNNTAKIFLRVEQGGEMQFGRFLIGEKVFSIKPTKKQKTDAAPGEKTFQFWLTGPYSPLEGVFFNQAINFGGQYTVHILISGEGSAWSEERVLRFYFDNGRLTPP